MRPAQGEGLPIAFALGLRDIGEHGLALIEGGEIQVWGGEFVVEGAERESLQSWSSEEENKPVGCMMIQATGESAEVAGAPTRMKICGVRRVEGGLA